MYNALCTWLRHAEPLTHHTYHTGNLAIDRLHDAELDKTATLLYALSELNYVVLYQKRQGPDMLYVVVPVFRPLEEKVDANGEKVKIMLVEGADPVQVMVYGELQSFRGSRGFEHGCIAEAEALAGIAVSDMIKTNRKRHRK